MANSSGNTPSDPPPDKNNNSSGDETTGASSQTAAMAAASENVIAVSSMQDQASGMIALDVESFANGFMQIMLSGIGWASGEIAKTKGTDGAPELKIFTDALQNDLPQIIQNINDAAKGSLQNAPQGVEGSDDKQKKSKFF